MILEQLILAYLPVPLAARSMAWLCGRSPVKIVGSNPTGSEWISVCCVCCVLSVRRADHSSRGFLPTVVRRCVWSRNLMNEEALGRVGGGCCVIRNKIFTYVGKMSAHVGKKGEFQVHWKLRYFKVVHTNTHYLRFNLISSSYLLFDPPLSLYNF